MINIDDINATIKELEAGNTTFDSCMKLAALYTVKDKLSENTVTQEVQTILPQYRDYCAVKRRYQMHEIGESIMFDSMQSVCAEMSEFISTVYSNTDTTVERALILNMLQRLVQTFSEVTI